MSPTPLCLSVVSLLCSVSVLIISSFFKMRNDPYTHFSQQPHNKLTWLVIFYYFFTKIKQNKTKK